MAMSMRDELKAISQEVQKVQVESGAEVFSKVFVLSTDSLCFQGHFPNYPIVPGIVQIMMAEIAISEIKQEECIIKEVKMCKFVKTISPNCNVLAKIFIVKENIWNCEIHADVLSGHFRLIC